MIVFTFRNLGLQDALTVLIEYDIGYVYQEDGVEDLREALQEYFDSISEQDRDDIATNYILTHYLSEEARAQGRGINDVRDFLDWFDDEIVSWDY